MSAVDSCHDSMILCLNILALWLSPTPNTCANGANATTTLLTPFLDPRWLLSFLMIVPPLLGFVG